MLQEIARLIQLISVLLTDDHALVRTGIRRLLEDSKQVTIVGEADCGEDSFKLAQSLYVPSGTPIFPRRSATDPRQVGSRRPE